MMVHIDDQFSLGHDLFFPPYLLAILGTELPYGTLVLGSRGCANAVLRMTGLVRLRLQEGGLGDEDEQSQEGNRGRATRAGDDLRRWLRRCRSAVLLRALPALRLRAPVRSKW